MTYSFAPCGKEGVCSGGACLERTRVATVDVAAHQQRQARRAFLLKLVPHHVTEGVLHNISRLWAPLARPLRGCPAPRDGL